MLEPDDVVFAQGSGRIGIPVSRDEEETRRGVARFVASDVEHEGDDPGMDTGWINA